MIPIRLRSLTPFAAASLLFLACAAPGPALEVAQVEPLDASDEPIHVVVLHTNDVHGQVHPRPATWKDREDPPPAGGLSRVAGYVESVREEALVSGAGFLVLDAGDWFQGTPEGQLDKGLAFTLALKEVGYDAMCVGNHEFDHGVQPLVKLLGEADLPALAANLEDPKTGRAVDWVDMTKEVNVGGMRVVIVGLLTPETPVITHESARTESILVFRDPSEVLSELMVLTAGMVDWWLPVTHMGIEHDRELARDHSLDPLPLIVGGHSHTFLNEGVREGETLIVQAGSKASVVGRVDLWFDRRTRDVLRSEAQLVDLFEERPAEERNARVDEACAVLAKRSSARMEETVGQLDGSLVRSKDPLTSSSAGNFVAEVMRAVLDSDIGIMNRGGIRRDLDAGPITRRMLFELCPFDNHLVQFTLTGAELFEITRRAVEDDDHSGLEVSGMTMEVRRGESGDSLVRILIGGEPLEANATYTVALNSFMAGGGDGYVDEAVKRNAPRVEDPRMLRKIFEDHFTTVGRVRPDETNRYLVLQTESK